MSAADWATIVAALLTLLGVLWGVIAGGRRDSREKRLDREDAYRQDARASIARLATSCGDFRRNAVVLSEPARWIPLGYKGATVIAESVESAMAQLGHDIVAASILVAEPELQRQLVVLDDAFDEVSAVVHDAVDAFWETAVQKYDAAAREAAWEAFDAAVSAMIDSARASLRSRVRTAQN